MQRPCLNFFALMTICCSLISCSEEQTEPALLRHLPAFKVVYGDANSVREFSGSAETDRIINLSFRANGIITQFDIFLGKQIKKGQLLAKLDNLQARLSYEQAVSALNSADSQMNTAKLNLDRIQSLYEKGNASLSEYESARNNFRTSKASFQSAQRSVEIQQEQVRFGFIYAPEDGVIAAVYKEVDENITAGEPVAVLNAGGKMEISLGLPESVINQVEQNMQVSVSIPSLPEQEFTGVVTEVSPSVDTTAATYPVRVSLTGDTEAIRSGMSARVAFNFNTNNVEGKLIVPSKAVGEDQSSRYVYLLETPPDANEEAEMIVRRQTVRVGRLSAEGFEILQGLQQGQWVATAGLKTLLPGQRVKLLAETP